MSEVLFYGSIPPFFLEKLYALLFVLFGALCLRLYEKLANDLGASEFVVCLVGRVWFGRWVE